MRVWTHQEYWTRDKERLSKQECKGGRMTPDNMFLSLILPMSCLCRILYQAFLLLFLSFLCLLLSPFFCVSSLFQSFLPLLFFPLLCSFSLPPSLISFHPSSFPSFHHFLPFPSSVIFFSFLCTLSFLFIFLSCSLSLLINLWIICMPETQTPLCLLAGNSIVFPCNNTFQP